MELVTELIPLSGGQVQPVIQAVVEISPVAYTVSGWTKLYSEIAATTMIRRNRQTLLEDFNIMPQKNELDRYMVPACP